MASPPEATAGGEPVPGLPERMQPIAASFDMFDSPVDMTKTARAFGVQLTPLEQAVRGMLAPAPV